MILVRRPNFTYVGTLWLIPNNIYFTCFCFTCCSSKRNFHSQFLLIIGEEVR